VGLVSYKPISPNHPTHISPFTYHLTVWLYRMLRSRPQMIAIVALIGVNAIWGLSFPVMKFLNQEVDHHFHVTPETASLGLRVGSVAWMISIRFGLALAMMAIFVRSLIRNASALEWKAGICIGTCFYLGLMCQVIGLATIPASRSGFLTSLTAIFIPLFTALVLRRAPDLFVCIAVTVALLGVAVLTELAAITATGISFTSQALQVWSLGDTLTTVGAIFFTGQILLVDRFGSRVNSTGLTPGMFSAVIVLAWITFAVSAPMASETIDAGWIDLALKPAFFPLLGILGSVCSLIAFIGMNRYQPYVTATQASIIYSLEPVFASGWALVLPGWISLLTGVSFANEQWTAPLVQGGSLILLANIIILWPRRKVQDSVRAS
jgi:drug/metabolite transporter (DMT)-like permease